MPTAVAMLTRGVRSETGTSAYTDGVWMWHCSANAMSGSARRPADALACVDSDCGQRPGTMAELAGAADRKRKALAEQLNKHPTHERERAALDMLGDPPFFAPGRRVLVHGLTKKPELNRLGGIVMPPGMKAGGTRLPVMMIGCPNPSKSIEPYDIFIRPANLRLVPYDGVSYDDELNGLWESYQRAYRKLAEREGRTYKSEASAASRAAQGLGRLRFAVGDRVVCNLGSCHGWHIGTVVQLDYWESSFRMRPDPAMTMPYQVHLDCGKYIFAQRDEENTILAATSAGIFQLLRQLESDNNADETENVAA